MERPRCATCPHFVNHELDGDEAWAEGCCLRFPPAYVGAPNNEDGCCHASADHWAQSHVCANDSCGEHPDFPAYIQSLRAIAPFA